jgi:hypothetical protein
MGISKPETIAEVEPSASSGLKTTGRFATKEEAMEPLEE